MSINFESIRLPEPLQQLREEVREFLQEEAEKGVFVPNAFRTGEGDARQFAQDVGRRGWIGMTWPREYGGRERSFLERYVVTEEMRAANAPTLSFLTADRQSGPMIIKYGSERVKRELLPRIVSGELSFCIGLSEANSGSDLFAARAKATKTDEGWVLNGAKLWTSTAHTADYMIGLFRTSPATKEDRRHGLSQFVIDMRSPGIIINAINHMNGKRHFSEVVFDDVLIPHDHLLGDVDAASKQATSELAYERSGPERVLANYQILPSLLRHLGGQLDRREADGVGRLVAQLHTLRRMSVSVNGMLEAGREPTVEGSIVKELGTLWQQHLAGQARELAAQRDTSAEPMSPSFEDRLADATVLAPQITIQGGTTEILRGIIARGLGLR